MGNHHQLGGRGARPSFQSQRRFFSNPKERKHLFKMEKCVSTDSSGSSDDFLSKLFALLNSVVKEFSSTTNSTISAGRLSKLFSTAVPFAMALGFSMIKGATGAEICMQFVNNLFRVTPDNARVANAFTSFFGAGDVSEFSCNELNQTAAYLQPSALPRCPGLLAHNLYGDTSLEVTNGTTLPKDYEKKVCLMLQGYDGVLFSFIMCAVLLMGIATFCACTGKNGAHGAPHAAPPVVGVVGGGGNHHHAGGAIGGDNHHQQHPVPHIGRAISVSHYGSTGLSMV